MTGYDSPEELIESIKDMGTQLYVHPEDRKRFLEIRDTKGFVDDFEVEFYKKDGNTFWGVINARTVKDEKGEILYFEGLIKISLFVSMPRNGFNRPLADSRKQSARLFRSWCLP